MNDYRMIVYKMQSGNGFDYVAEYPALKGVAGVGSNELEAVRNLRLNAEINIIALQEAGLPIPEGDALLRDDYSGKLSLRLSKTLHRKLAQLSEIEGVSINQCIVEAVSMYVSKEIYLHELVKRPNEIEQSRIISTTG